MPDPKIISVVGASGSGKTTLIEKLIPALKSLGLKVGTVKHDVHGFEIDKPGKDSWKHKKAGADITVISSPDRIGIVKDVDHDWNIKELEFFFSDVDLVLTEGYKKENRPKIEVFRPEVYDKPVCAGDKNLVALISDTHLDIGVPEFRTGEINELVKFLTVKFNLNVL